VHHRRYPKFNELTMKHVARVSTIQRSYIQELKDLNGLKKQSVISHRTCPIALYRLNFTAKNNNNIRWRYIVRARARVVMR